MARIAAVRCVRFGQVRGQAVNGSAVHGADAAASAGKVAQLCSPPNKDQPFAGLSVPSVGTAGARLLSDWTEDLSGHIAGTLALCV